MSLTGERATLVKALSTVAVTDRRRMLRRFLEGLSTEELRYIASYLGACLIESTLHTRAASRAEIAWGILQYEECRVKRDDMPRWSRAGGVLPNDLEHKMILLLEYLNSCQNKARVRIAAGSA
jgi:hypothetical protein